LPVIGEKQFLQEHRSRINGVVR